MDEPTIEAKVAESRAQLESTLDAIEDKLNVPKQVSKLAERTRASYESNPVPWIIGATAAAIVAAGLIAWAVLSDDE
jgi:Protein of unknown function (DUF3618)